MVQDPAPATSIRLVEPSEAEIEAAAPSAFDDLFVRYAPYVAAVALRVIGRDSEVDDLVQEVFLAAYKGIGQLRDPRALKGWLAAITVRMSHRQLRKRRLRKLMGLDTDAAEYVNVAAPGISPERRALLARVYQVLDDVPSKERVAWTLRFVEGESLEQVAELCACSLATAKRRISAAQLKLQQVVGHA